MLRRRPNSPGCARLCSSSRRCITKIPSRSLFGGFVSMDFSSFQLQDKIAIVTGPSQGIGRAIALGLATAGAHLVLAEHPDFHPEDLKAVKAEIEKMGRKAIIALTDISKVDQVRAMVDVAVKNFGRLDILVNNAGWTCNGPALDVTE